MRRSPSVTHYSFSYEVSKPPRWDRFVSGLAVNIAALMLLIAVAPRLTSWVPLEPVETRHYITLVAPVLSPPRVTPPPPIHIRPQVVAKMEVPKIRPAPPAPVKPPEPVRVEPPKPEMPKVAAASPPPKPAAPIVKKTETNVFGSAGSEVATVHKPPREVQTGGFGDPNGVRGKGDPKRQTLTVANVGSFELPPGPGTGNGTGGTHGVSGTIRSAGFADGVASPGPHGPGNRGGVVEGGFGDAVASSGGSGPRLADKKPALKPVEIVYKPRPVYTPEARQLRVEGEVLLDVVFLANGSLRVNRVVKGLGHGLDGAATSAAERIRFHPALRNGQPYDCAALVHIVFELAD
jgi:TonB family protein